MHTCVYRCVYVCMYVCACVCVFVCACTYVTLSFPTFSLAGRHATIDGKKCLNFGTYNFLGFLEKKRIHVSDYMANTLSA